MRSRVHSSILVGQAELLLGLADPVANGGLAALPTEDAEVGVRHPDLPRPAEVVDGHVLQAVVGIAEDAAPARDDGDVLQHLAKLRAEQGRLGSHQAVELATVAVHHHQPDGGVAHLGARITSDRSPAAAHASRTGNTCSAAPGDGRSPGCAD